MQRRKRGLKKQANATSATYAVYVAFRKVSRDYVHDVLRYQASALRFSFPLASPIVRHAE